ncbi:MAG: peroxiredoxin [Armatimonadota bacterium]
MEEKGLPLIGDPAPAFTAQTTHGELKFPDDYQGKWVILFSHPADFTPVCTTEFMTFASMAEDFKALNCELIGLSIDSNYSHIAWARTIEEKIEYKDMKNVHIGFPIIADLTMEVAHKYGMLHPNADTTHAVRATFIIDPEGTVRAILYYPQSNGRNMDEIIRLLKALQTADRHKVATPANWQPGDEVIIPPPPTTQVAAERVSGAGTDYRCLDWFLCLKKLPE